MQAFWLWCFSRDGWWFAAGSWSAYVLPLSFAGRYWLAAVFATLGVLAAVKAERTPR